MYDEDRRGGGRREEGEEGGRKGGRKGEKEEYGMRGKRGRGLMMKKG